MIGSSHSVEYNSLPFNNHNPSKMRDVSSLISELQVEEEQHDEMTY